MVQIIMKKNEIMRIEISQERIALPNRGARVEEVEFCKSENSSAVGYYRIKGHIFSVDQEAPDISFQMNAPEKWNGRVLQYGGALFDGYLVTGEDPYAGQKKSELPPVQRGYITFGNDGGHTCTSVWDASWGQYDEALHNFASDSLKKTYDVVMELTSLLYEKTPKAVYFIGASNGGREGLKAIQRWQMDYQGAIILFPVLNWVGKAIADSHREDVLESMPQGRISTEEYKKFLQVVQKVLTEKCREGIVLTHQITETERQEIRKQAGDFLSEEQLRSLDLFAEPFSFPYELANGVRNIPGYYVYIGEELADSSFNIFGIGKKKRDATMAEFGDAVICGQIMQDMSFSPGKYDIMCWKDRIQMASRILDATSTDLDSFRENGAKLLMLHGLSDQVVSPGSSIQYFRGLTKRYQNQCEDFARLYLVPGYGHGMGENFILGADLLEVLEAWSEEGKYPEVILAEDQNDQYPGRTLNLIPWEETL